MAEPGQRRPGAGGVDRPLAGLCGKGPLRPGAPGPVAHCQPGLLCPGFVVSALLPAAPGGIQDWSALLDTAGAVVQVSAFLLVTTLLDNLAALALSGAAAE